MKLKKGQQVGLSLLMAVVFSYTIVICIHQSRCINDYCNKTVWISRNIERQFHGPVYRLDIDYGIVPQNERNEIFHFSEGMANVSLHERWGFIDQSGKWVIEPRFSGAGPYANGLAWVLRKDKFGFVDRTGRMVIPPQFDNIRDFTGGLAAVRLGKFWGFIDLNGRLVVPPIFEWTDSFNEGLALVKKKGLFGYINPKGRWVIKPHFSDALRFQDGLAGVMIKGKFGFINPQGKIVINPQYDQTAGFSEGLAAVKINNLLGYINRYGQTVIQGRFMTLGNFHQGRAIVTRDNLVYRLDQTGNLKLTGFKYMQDLYEEYAAVGVDEKIMVKVRISKKVKMRIFNFVRTMTKYELKNQVKIIQKYVFCNSRLEKVGAQWYPEVWPYSQGLAAVQVGKKIGFIRNGEEVIKPEFDWVDPDKY